MSAGYSFTREHTNAYAKTLEDMCKDIVEILRQFLLLFPEYNKRDFYVAGESYVSTLGSAGT